MIRLVSRHPDWAIGFEDECWWSRFKQPSLSSWVVGDQVMHLIERLPKPKEQQKALACYGLLVRHCPQTENDWHEEIMLRFVDDRPISVLTTQYLEWCCEKLQSKGKRVLILVWDNASWHISKFVRTWIYEHNRKVTTLGQGVRIWVCPLPTKSPWLNPIEPKWVHGKRRVVEPGRKLSPAELEERVYNALDCSSEPHLTLSNNVV